MLIKDGDKYHAGNFDVIGIMKDTSTGRFHACVWEEHFMPGPEQPETFVRLKSKMHHTAGADTYEGGLEHVRQLREQVVIAEENVWIKPEQVVERDFDVQGYAEVVVVPRWKAA